MWLGFSVLTQVMRIEAAPPGKSEDVVRASKGFPPPPPPASPLLGGRWGDFRVDPGVLGSRCISAAPSSSRHSSRHLGFTCRDFPPGSPRGSLALADLSPCPLRPSDDMIRGTISLCPEAQAISGPNFYPGFLFVLPIRVLPCNSLTSS